MKGERRQIVAFGGGGFSMERGNPLLDDYGLRQIVLGDPTILLEQIQNLQVDFIDLCHER